MQIHAGRYKGRRIKTVANVSYRPTMALVRKSLFDILGDLTGYHVLDLFSGSGILGFEAASRGAKSVTFVETSMRISSLLKINGSFFKDTEINYVRMDALKFMKQSNHFDLIMADPPYEYDQTNLLIESCINQLNENRFFILESSPRSYSISPARVKEYGDTQLTFWKKEQ
ncbi:MAG: 16S rRNA (guanine(966)-N(2))-methyltransferase RsmD [Candidatus Marinimicrobia bacterium]|nr:16S rRNA (guanine(966)-N(2))-methyltransferase RsmD [Candidatus Neomarinimicrobiota bacterium]MBL7010031.1 16S rRNA (guanine(966)-N(2))-methyltransferase RsmD [Candidatus Neomarinimicrobiota bacterium]MBL7030300.1 16S rRNA (guanine(966)-N(2))-methyltransferase RsmD [Candidatus Neomarinimicrobiota bacterium]